MDGLRGCDKVLFAKLEDLTGDENSLSSLLSFLDIEYSASFFKAIQTPEHVYIPVDFPLTEEQEKQFDAIAGGMMQTLGYTGKEYRVNYGV